MKHVTQMDVAQVVGCSQITVSRALNNDARVSPRLRERIKKASKDLGYRPDPMLKALVSLRRYNSAKSLSASIAFLYAKNKPDKNTIFTNWEYYEGARRKAEQLGFTIELMQFVQEMKHAERFAQILRSRGVGGVIYALASAHLIFYRPVAELLDFPSVILGYNFINAPIHCIMPDYYNIATVVLGKALEKGYKRIGLMLSCTQNERTDHAFVDVYSRIMKAHNLYSEDAIYLFQHASDELKAQIPGHLDEWLPKAQPDIVIGDSGAGLHLRAYMEARGKQLGKDLPFLCVDIRARHNDSDSGMVGNRILMGELAVEHIYKQILNNERGLPNTYQRTLVQSQWRDLGTF